MGDDKEKKWGVKDKESIRTKSNEISVHDEKKNQTRLETLFACLSRTLDTAQKNAVFH